MLNSNSKGPVFTIKNAGLVVCTDCTGCTHTHKNLNAYTNTQTRFTYSGDLHSDPVYVQHGVPQVWMISFFFILAFSVLAYLSNCFLSIVLFLLLLIILLLIDYSIFTLKIPKYISAVPPLLLLAQYSLL